MIGDLLVFFLAQGVTFMTQIYVVIRFIRYESLKKFKKHLVDE